MNAAFIGLPEDEKYVQHLKHMFNGLSVYLFYSPITLLTQLEIYCTKRSVTKVVSTNPELLQTLLRFQGSDVKIKSIGDYEGSLFSYRGIDIVFIAPLKQLQTIKYARFLCQRWISKVAAPDSWAESTEFVWQFLDTPEKITAAYEKLSSAYAIAVDIETLRQNLLIRCISYTGIFFEGGKPKTISYVLALGSSYNLAWMRKFNGLSAQKIFQNGKYDNSYLLRYNAPITNWQWDTINQFHCWYSELPKDLGILGAFFIRKVVYWKDLSQTTDLFEFYKYNALDTWATANVWIQWILQSPEWAKRNYTLEFPLVFPCLLAEMTGMMRDVDRVKANRKLIDAKEDKVLSSLRKSLGAPNFNPASHVQVKDLLKILGCGDIAAVSSDEIHLKKAAIRHPLNARLLKQVLDIRGYRKLKSNYLRVEDDVEDGNKGAKEFKGTILYALNPHGTDSGRLASREHHFWTGLQIQNVSSRDGPEVKETFISAFGFYFGEADLEQAESRDTGHITGDENLIKAVSGIRDFHSVNCSTFFVVPYENIFDDSTKKTKDKPLRDLAKRVNHGANYNMGPGVLIDTMGLDKIWEAGRLLKLPFTDPKRIATYLLDCFHRTYAKIKSVYYPAVILEVTTTKKLTSRAYHHTEWNKKTHLDVEKYIGEGDWTRYCFGNPDKSKEDLNSYVAHAPQSLNARTLNEAWLNVFYEIALAYPKTFRLHAQIHDSILFSYAEGHEDLAVKVKELLEIPVTVRDVSGTYRTFTVPATLKIGKSGKPAKYWSETE